MTKNRRTAAILLTILIIFSLFFSAFFIAAETEHDCTGDNCPICHEIQVCLQTLNTIGTALGVTVTVFAVIRFLVIRIAAVFRRFVSRTLVSLKVKMSD